MPTLTNYRSTTLKSLICRILRVTSRHRLVATGFVIAVAAITVGLIGQPAHSASAAGATSQCNSEMNGGGTEVACTVTVVNYLSASGELSQTPPSTVTMTRCVGASGPLGTLTCTTTTSVSTQPVTAVRQCDASGNGGGGSVVCTATITNHFSGSPGSVTPATVYQCIGSVITGTGAPGTCTPANTPGVTSVTAATVGQCNGSGNGGTNVRFTCSVTPGSNITQALPLNIDQCNGSANGGGALVVCEVTVVNDVATTPSPTTPPGATVTPNSSPTAAPGTSPVASPATSPGASVTPVTTGTPVPTRGLASPTPANATARPESTPAGNVPAVSSTPRPPATGNAGPASHPGAGNRLLVLGIIAAAGLMAGLGLKSRWTHHQ